MELIMKSDHHVHVKINDQDHSHEQQQDDQLQQQQQHFHVLAVDDSLIDRKLLEKLLKVSSYKVTCVDSGDEALKYLGLVDDDVDKNSPASSSSSSSSPQSPAQEGLKVNLIMTDYCMPGMSGYDLLKRVKESSWKDVPVVIMSSENVPSRISKCLEGGAEEFLLKPLQLSDLKNLENYLLKPLDLSCQSNTVTSSTAEDHFTANDDICSSDDNNNSMVELDSSKSNNNNSSIMISKRKAAVSPEPSERRPKAKGLAVV